jgi:hypothetical protein
MEGSLWRHFSVSRQRVHSIVKPLCPHGGPSLLLKSPNSHRRLYGDTSLFQDRGLARFLTPLSIWRVLSIVKISMFEYNTLNGNTLRFKKTRLIDKSITPYRGPSLLFVKISISIWRALSMATLLCFKTEGPLDC